MCGGFRDQMLDELYGLLEPAESAALAAHVAGCPDCTVATVKARADYALLGKATKSSFPKVEFRPPIEASTNRAPERSEKSSWLSWAIAASVLIVALGTIGPALRTVGTYATAKSKLVDLQDRMDRDEANLRSVRAELESAIAKAQTDVDSAKARHDEVAKAWVTAEKAAGVPFSVTVRGPAAAIPGAPNEYGIAAIDGADRPIAAEFTATVRGSGGAVYFESKFATRDGRGANLRIPATVWTKAKPNEALSLAVTATNPVTKQKSELSEPVAVLTASYATVLSTDAPIYRPGDQIAFRSLTLDRTRFTPPERDLSLVYCLLDSNGAVVKVGSEQRDMSLIGSTRLESASDANPSQPMAGPDGKPIRGIGCGELRIPTSVPAGNYKLVVYERPLGVTAVPPPGQSPLATRPIVIQPFEAHKYFKSITFDKASYLPGEKVVATLSVSDQGRPVSGRQLMISATADGRPIQDLTHSPLVDGKATIRFTLPKEINLASISAAVLDGIHETIVRPVPLVTGQVKVEFFPEGGDLIAGVPNRIYLRGLRPDGRPADFDGVIRQGDRVVAAVRSVTSADDPSSNRGFATVTFTPVAGQSYRFETASSQSFALPAVKADGVAMSIPAGVVAANQPIVVKLASTANRRLVVGAYARGTPIAHAAVEVDAGQPIDVTLPVDVAAPGGVVRVTVFEEPDQTRPGRIDLKPLSERLIFRMHPKRLELSVTVESNSPEAVKPSKPGFRPAEPIRIRAKAKDESGQPVPAILFASVATESLYAAADDLTERTLPTHFLLAGEIERPDQLERADLLLNDSPASRIALDGLLGTQGWRRFAEQNPAQFRRTAPPDDADRLLVAVGTRAPVSPEFKPAIERVIREYQPKYEAAYETLSAAERKREMVRLRSPAAEAYGKVREQRRVLLQNWNDEASELKNAIGDERRTGMAQLISGVLIGFALLLLGVRFAFGRRWPARGVLTKAAIAIALLALVPAACDGFVMSRIRSIPAPAMLEASSPDIAAPIFSGIEEPTTRTESIGSAPIRLRPSATATDRPDGRPIVLTHDGIDLGRRDSGHHDDNRLAALVRRERREKLLESLDSPSLTAVAGANVPCRVREYAVQDGSLMGAFSEVLYWHPVIVVPESGESAGMVFTLNDAVASYRVTLAGHTLDGRLGQTTTRISVRKPIEAGARLPREIGMADRVDLVASMTVDLAAPVPAAGLRPGEFAVTPELDFLRPRLFIRGTDHLAIATSNERESEDLPIDDRTGIGRRIVRVTPLRPGTATLSVHAANIESTLGDVAIRGLTVAPDGLPVAGGQTVEVGKSKTVALSIPADVQSPVLTIRRANDPATEFESSVASMRRNPAGCFEQTASLAYPDLLRVPFLESAQAKAVRDSLPELVNRLRTYECRSSTGGRAGFEWFGGSAPPHEALTAYGLLLMTDANRLRPIDPELLGRTQAFLLGRRDGAGGFRVSPEARDQFGRAPNSVNNAYITYALRHADAALDLTREIEAVTAEAISSNDPYRLALAALVATDPQPLLSALAAKQATDGGVPGAETSITSSTGPDLTTETTALAVIAWRTRPGFESNVARAEASLMRRRQPTGGFGGTQATVLALNALAPTWSRATATGTFGVTIAATTITRPLSESIECPVKPGDNTLILSTDATNPVPLRLSWQGLRDIRPSRHPKLGFEAQLARVECDESETIPLTVTVANRDSIDSGMIVATVGLPAGLSLPSDLKQIGELTTRAASGELLPARVEVFGREMRLYYRHLPPGASSLCRIDLIAAYPGQYVGPASRAIRSYDPTVTVVNEPLRLTIRPARQSR